METGIFILSETVQNPAPDRRTRGKWQQATEWKSGWRFSIRRAEHLEREEAPNFKAFSLMCLEDAHAESVTFWEREGAPLVVAGYRGDDTGTPEALTRLAGLLRPSTTQRDEFVWLFHRNRDDMRGGAADALWHLFKSGKVTAADIAAAQAASENESRGELATSDE
ncbi:MAG: hypothetical protein ACHREM_00945 [Polyangiales bacterium]